MKSGMSVLVDYMALLRRAVEAIDKDAVFVGVPKEKSGRKDSVSNAMMAYVHENGSPARHIPARPFMSTGIKSVQPEITKDLKNGVKKTLSSFDAGAIDVANNRAGLIAQNAIRAAITNGDGFAPLAESTIEARQRRGRKSTSENVTPLVDTGQLRNSITYVVGAKNGDH